MKLVGDPKRVAIAILLVVALAEAGYIAHLKTGGDVTTDAARRSDRRLGAMTVAPALCGKANLARRSGKTQEALDMLMALQKKFPDTAASAEGLVTMADMVAVGEAPAELITDLYEWALTCRNPASVTQRAKILPYLRKMDAAGQWKLHRLTLIQASGWPARIQDDILAAVTVFIQAADETAVDTVLTEALETPGLKGGLAGKIAETLIKRAETGKGIEAGLALARQLAEKHAYNEGGLAAFRHAYETTLRLQGDAEASALLKDYALGQGGGPVHLEARERLAIHYIEQGDMENAVAVYCGNAGADEMLNLNPDVLEKAADSVVRAAAREEVTRVNLLARLAADATERRMPRTAAALYERAALQLQDPELREDARKTPFAESDSATFWQAYVLWRQGETDRARSLYEQLLPKYSEGWQVAQMLYDLAKGHLAALRYEDAVAMAERCTNTMPKNSAMENLLHEAREAFETDEALAAEALALQKELESAVAPLARAERGLKIAHIESRRKNFQKALQGYREVWGKYPETPHAPKAMYAAAEMLVDPMRDNRAAKAVIEELVLNYPSSEMSARAFALLKKMDGN